MKGANVQALPNTRPAGIEPVQSTRKSRRPQDEDITILDRFAVSMQKHFLNQPGIARRLLNGSAVRLRQQIARASYRMAEAMLAERCDREMDAEPIALEVCSALVEAHEASGATDEPELVRKAREALLRKRGGVV